MSWYKKNVGSYTIRIKALDCAGNSATIEKEQKSAVASSVDYFVNLVGEIWSAAVELAMSMLTMLWDWIVEQVMKIWNAVIEPLIDVISGYLAGIVESLKDVCIELSDFEWSGSSSVPSGFNTDSETADVLEALLAFMLSFVGLQDQAENLMTALQQITTFVEPFLSIIGSIQELPFKLLRMLCGAVLPESIQTMLSTIVDSASDFAETMLTSLLRLIIGKDGSLFSLFFPGISLSTDSHCNVAGISLPTFNSILNFLTVFDLPFFGLDSIVNSLKTILGEYTTSSSTRASADDGHRSNSFTLSLLLATGFIIVYMIIYRVLAGKGKLGVGLLQKQVYQRWRELNKAKSGLIRNGVRAISDFIKAIGKGKGKTKTWGGAGYYIYQGFSAIGAGISVFAFTYINTNEGGNLADGITKSDLDHSYPTLGLFLQIGGAMTLFAEIFAVILIKGQFKSFAEGIWTLLSLLFGSASFVVGGKIKG